VAYLQHFCLIMQRLSSNEICNIVGLREIFSHLTRHRVTWHSLLDGPLVGGSGNKWSNCQKIF